MRRRISIDFQQRPGWQRQRRRLAWLGSAVGGLIVLLVHMYIEFSIRNLSKDLRIVEDQISLSTRAASEGDLGSRTGEVDQEDLAENRNWEALFMNIERAFDGDVVLESMDAPADAAVGLGGHGKSIDAVLKVIDGLRKGRSVGEVELISHDVNSIEGARYPVNFSAKFSMK